MMINMKKILIVTSILAVLVSTAVLVMSEKSTQPVKSSQSINKPTRKDFEKRKLEFEKRLKLTDEQKQQMGKLHAESFKKIKPIMDEIRLKQVELVNVENSDIEESSKHEKMDALHREIFDLHRQEREIRRENMREFENLLTTSQRKELLKMKREGRKDFERRHPPRPPFGRSPEMKEPPRPMP